MADESWYRRRTWSPTDQTEFFSRLHRSRSGFHKAQYCRIQAYELECAGEYQAALELLDLLMREWGTDVWAAQVFEQKAQCLEKIGEHKSAITAYRAAFDAQRRKSNVHTRAYQEFGWLVAMTPHPELYDEALSVLDEFDESHDFPAGDFRTATIRALIWDAKGDHIRARRHANEALAASRKRHSGFANHPTLGLVENVQPELRERIERMAKYSG